MKTLQTFSTTQVQQAKRSRFNPLASINPTSLTRFLDAFEAGYLRDAACVWDALEQRDDLLRTVIAKRKKSVARHGWTVLPKPNLTDTEKEQAKEHAQALEFFYGNLQCEHAVDSAEKGGFKLLARQMMDAVGKRFAVHEILWQANEQSDSNRNFVTAKFRFVPLGFFENTTGKLRFLENESSIAGRELEAGAWMITTGDGLMAASSTAWMFKHLALNDWLNCSKKNGTPGLRGVSAAARDSAEWNALERSVVDLLDGKPIIHGTSDDIQVIDLLPRGTMPFPQLVERIDRLLAALWRGADLSTLSRDRGYGASLQEKETCALEEDDAELLTETLNRYVDEWVIRYVFGEEVKPFAYVKVLVSPRECTTADLQIDEFLIRNGAPLSLQETMSRYGRALPKPGEPIFDLPHTKSAKIQRKEFQASYPESSYRASAQGKSAQRSEMVMKNEETLWGPAVTFRDSSPVGESKKEELGSKKSGPGHEGEMSNDQALMTKECPSTNSTIENQFTILQCDWLQLSPYGDFPHARGLQRVDRAAAETLVAQFNSFRGRLGRLFGGVPFYIGHPDVPNASEIADRKAYGWVNQLETREDGLYGQVKWSDAGLDLLKNAHFKYLSPYWEAREIGTENGRRVYQPVALVSVGLTNQPNIPVKPLANESARREREPVAEDGMTNDQALMTKECPSTNSSMERSSRGDETQTSSQLTRAENSQSLLTSTATRPKMHTESLTNNLGSRRGELVLMHNRRDRIQEAVLAKTHLGLSYDEAWESVKREHSTWFEEQ
jgi:hypothetical protein